MRILENFKKKREFNADNCRRKQQKRKDEDFVRKIDDIKGRIEFVINNSNDEHAVIYCIRDYEKELFERVQQYFNERNFYTTIITVEGLDNEYIIISW